MPDQFRSFWSRHKFNRRLFICLECDAKRNRIERQNRRDSETPLERKVREALWVTGYKATAEFALGCYFYDFAIPKHKILLEIDGKTYHRARSKKLRDGRKDRLAKEEGWKLIRVSSAVPNVPKEALKMIRKCIQRKLPKQLREDSAPAKKAPKLNFEQRVQRCVELWKSN